MAFTCVSQARKQTYNSAKPGTSHLHHQLPAGCPVNLLVISESSNRSHRGNEGQASQKKRHARFAAPSSHCDPLKVASSAERTLRTLLFQMRKYFRNLRIRERTLETSELLNKKVDKRAGNVPCKVCGLIFAVRFLQGEESSCR
jgi:hypothetical protein